MGNEQCCANNKGDEHTEAIQIEAGGNSKAANNPMSSAPGEFNNYGSNNKHSEGSNSVLANEPGPIIPDLPLEQLDSNGDIQEMMSKHGRCKFDVADYPGMDNEVTTTLKTFEDDSKYIG